MKLQSNRIAFVAPVLLAVICTVSTLLLYWLEGNIGSRLVYISTASGVLCVFLIYMIVINIDRIMNQSFCLYVMIGLYLLVCLLLCFPNYYTERLSFYYLIAIPIATIFGFRYAAVTVIALFLILSLKYGTILPKEILHATYAQLSALAAASKKNREKEYRPVLFVFVLQAIMYFMFIQENPQGYSLQDEGTIILMSCAFIIASWKLSELGESMTKECSLENGNLTEEFAVTDASEADIMKSVLDSNDEETIFRDDQAEMIVDENQNMQKLSYPYDMKYLLQDDCEIASHMKNYAPRAFHRAKEIADFSRTVALRVGANSDLVYTAALYHDFDRFYGDREDKEQILPESLYFIIKQQNRKDELPTSLEALIVLISNHFLAIYHYIERNGTKISLDKVIDNIFSMHMKKGSIMSSGISMSMYHKMKQEFQKAFHEKYNSQQQENGTT